MVYQDLVAEIENLSLAEQPSLMETLARFISRRTVKPNAPEGSLERVRGLLKPAPGESMPPDLKS